MPIDESKRHKRYKREKLSAEKLRTNCVSVRLNDAELAELNKLRDPFKMEKGEYLRCCAFGTLPTAIPEANRKAYITLGRIGNNINQIVRAIHMDESVPVDEIRAIMLELRDQLLQIKQN